MESDGGETSAKLAQIGLTTGRSRRRRAVRGVPAPDGVGAADGVIGGRQGRSRRRRFQPQESPISRVPPFGSSGDFRGGPRSLGDASGQASALAGALCRSRIEIRNIVIIVAVAQKGHDFATEHGEPGKSFAASLDEDLKIQISTIRVALSMAE